MTGTILKGTKVSDQFQDTGSSHAMPDKTLGIIEAGLVGTAKNRPQGRTFLDISATGPSRMRTNHIDLARLQSSALQRQLHALGLPLGIGQHEIRGIRVHGVAR